MYRIVKKRTLTPITKLYEVEAPLVAKKAKAGQFVILRVNDHGERIPLTLCDWNPEAGTITIVVQEVGKTSKLIGMMEEGDAFSDLVGPLGKPAEMLEHGHAVIIGGGFGVAPILPKVKALHEAGVKVTSIIGFRNSDLIILEDEVSAPSDRVLLATEDGSRGKKGRVTDVLQELIDNGEKIDEVIAIGPMVMMQAVAEVTRPYGIKTLISADPIMVDGTGMCGACRMTVGNEVKFACVDGPVFDAHKVDFPEAVRRGRMYREEQQIAVHTCQCGGKI